MKICNACGKQLPDQVNFCNKCGANVSQLLPVVEPDPSQAATGSGLKICPQCGNHLPAAVKFCNKCGASVAAVSPEAALSAAGASVASDAADIKQPLVTPVEPAAPTGPVAEEPAAAIQMTPDKPKSGKLVLWVIVIVALLAASTAGGYFLYTKFFQTSKPAINEQPVATKQQAPATPAPASVPEPASPPAQGPQSGSTQAPITTTPPPVVPAPSTPYAPAEVKPEPAAPVPAPDLQPRHQTRVAGVRVKASAMINDVRNNKPYGFGTQFPFGASRVAHYVYYDNAIPHQTILSSRYYKDGEFLFACQNRPVQYSMGRYYCRPGTNLAPGNYEVKFGIDGVETQTLKFSVN